MPQLEEEAGRGSQCRTGHQGPADCCFSQLLSGLHSLSQQWPECGLRKAHRAPWGPACPPYARSCMAVLVVHGKRSRLSGNDSHPRTASQAELHLPTGPASALHGALCLSFEPRSSG